MLPRMALNGSFSVYYFIGEPNTSITGTTNTFIHEPSLAGFSFNLSGSAESCQNCANHAQQRLMVTNTEMITPMLIDYIIVHKLASLDPKDVKPFLIDRLRWRIVAVSFSPLTHSIIN
jgi:hypothetical protein